MKENPQLQGVNPTHGNDQKAGGSAGRQGGRGRDTQNISPARENLLIKEIRGKKRKRAPREQVQKGKSRLGLGKTRRRQVSEGKKKAHPKEYRTKDVKRGGTG